MTAEDGTAVGRRCQGGEGEDVLERAQGGGLATDRLPVPKLILDLAVVVGGLLEQPGRGR